jgi:hypothetical protein
MIQTYKTRTQTSTAEDSPLGWRAAVLEVEPIEVRLHLLNQGLLPRGGHRPQRREVCVYDPDRRTSEPREPGN